MIDASIPFRASQAGQINLVELMQQAQDYKLREMQVQNAQREQAQQQERQGALVDLMRGAQGGQLPTQGPAFDRYRDADPEGAFKMLGELDERKREEVKAGLADMSAAVQWADTPDKWAQVQAHYGKFDPALAQVPFEQRQAALMRLGQMGEYLKATAPKIMSIEAGGSLAAVDPRTGQPTFTVLPNPGDQAPGGSVGASIPRGAIDMLRKNPSLAPQFDAKYGQGASKTVLGGQPAGTTPFGP